MPKLCEKHFLQKISAQHFGYIYVLRSERYLCGAYRGAYFGRKSRGFVRNAFYAIIYGINWVLLAVVNNLALKTGPLSYT